MPEFGFNRLSRLLLALIAVSSVACVEEEFDVLVVTQHTGSLTTDWETDGSGRTEPFRIGSLGLSSDRLVIDVSDVSSLGPFVSRSDSVPWFDETCFPMRVSKADEMIPAGFGSVVVSEIPDTAVNRMVPAGRQFYVMGYLNGSYELPSGRLVDLGEIYKDRGSNDPSILVDEEAKTITIVCNVLPADAFAVLSIDIEGAGELVLNGSWPEVPVRCTSASDFCAAGSGFQEDVEVSVPAAAIDGFLGFRNAGAEGSCPLADEPVRDTYQAEGGSCIAVFDGWSTDVTVTPENLGLEVVALDADTRLAPGTTDNVQVLGDLASARIELRSNGFPATVVGTSGDCVPSDAVGRVILERPASGSRGACTVEVAPDAEPDEPTLSLLGATAPSFTVAPGPSGNRLDCATDETTGEVGCTDGGTDVALPLVYASPTEVEVEIPATGGRPSFAGRCVTAMGDPHRASLRVERGRNVCQPKLFHTLEITTEVSVVLDPGLDGQPTTLCDPSRDGVDCDGDGSTDEVEYPRPTRVTLTAQEPASFTVACSATGNPDEATVLVRDRVACTIIAASTQTDARLEIVLDADSGDPASRVLVLDPATGDEVDRCAYDAASGYAARTCVLTGLPRTMILAPEGDGSGAQRYANFVRFDGDCAGQTTSVADGYELDIYDVIGTGDAPSNNNASCTAVFGCTPDAVLESIEIALVDGTTTHGTLTANVGTECAPGATYNCPFTGTSIDVPENTPIDIVTTVSGGAPGRFESAQLNFTPLTTPQFRKTSAGPLPLAVRLGGCDNDYQVTFVVE